MRAARGFRTRRVALHPRSPRSLPAVLRIAALPPTQRLQQESLKRAVDFNGDDAAQRELDIIEDFFDRVGCTEWDSELYLRLRDAVLMEEEATHEALLRVYRQGKTSTLTQQGAVLTELSVTLEGTLFRMFKLKSSRPQDVTRRPGASCRAAPVSGRRLGKHRFSDGDSVVLSRTREDWQSLANPAAMDEKLCDAVVYSTDSNAITLVVDPFNYSRFEALQTRNALWRLDRPFKNVTARRQLAAIDQIRSFVWESDAVHAFQATLLGRTFSDAPELRPAWTTDSALQQSLQRTIDANGALNPSQKRAIQTAIQQRVTLWQGPPGSGKTHTLLALIEHLCVEGRGNGGVPCPILVCAETNAAVDNLVYGLMRRRVRVVRIGPPAKTRRHLLHSTLEARAEKTEDGSRAQRARQNALKLKQYLVSAGAELDDAEKREIRTRQRIQEKEAEAAFRSACCCVLDSCEVVACTCSSAGDGSLVGRSFVMVVIDEATQSTEPCALIPLLMGAESLVMAGDPAQLPPTVLSTQAQKAGLDLHDRDTCLGSRPLLLDTQYRMHPQISEFPSAWFYRSQLKTAAICARYALPKGVPFETWRAPVLFLHHRCEESRSERDVMRHEPSFRNAGEAAEVVRVVEALLQPGDVSDIAVLSPYRGQVALLRRLFERAGVESGVTVCTIDSFQGRECDVAVFSTVRCNPQRKLGFLADARRMNVAITRARKGLIVLGNRRTLSASRDWRSWIEWVQRHATVTSVT